MPRPITAHELAEYVRCPRAWWYERHEALARFDDEALTERLHTRRAAPGRHDVEIAVIVRLLERHRRFARGRAVHAVDARQSSAGARRLGCLPVVALLCVAALILCGLILT